MQTRTICSEKAFAPLGLGCWVFDTQLWNEQLGFQLLDTMSAALERGINHFDTAEGYGEGASERLLGKFFALNNNHRQQIFLASKANITGLDPHSMFESVRSSLDRLRCDSIDLYYIHWPRTGADLRPVMEGLEMARSQGFIKAVGVSNFSVEQMRQVSQVGRIDAHQLPYNLLWRAAEREIIPYCLQHGIAVITYASIAHGILTGKFPRRPQLRPGDHRNTILLFQEPTWAYVYEAVEEMNNLAHEIGRPLQQLAVRWSLDRPGITCALVGANSPAQLNENAAALDEDLDPSAWIDRLTAISDRLIPHIPDTANPYGYNP